jgi:hypothetical protein
MNSKEIATSTPYTIQNYDNYLKDYINITGFQWDSKCLDVAFRNLGNNFEKYVQKIGEFNTVAASNPQYTPPRTYQEKDYSRPCPEGWTESGGGCVNPSYQGTCDAGQTKQVKRSAVCPNNSSGASQISYPTFVTVPYKGRTCYWNFCFTNWWTSYRSEIRWNAYNNQNYYDGWSGPIDYGWWNSCTANVDYSRTGSLDKSQSDCRDSGNGNSPSGTTCWIHPTYDYKTDPPGYPGSSNEKKRNWENRCNAYWPMRTITIPGKWTCQYGDSIYNDIGRGNLIQLPVSVNSIIEAAKIGLQSNKMVDNYFAIIDNNLYIVGQNSNVGVITSKGTYQPNCFENNNKKINLYMINQEFFNMLQNCKTVNDKINDVNINRDILQNAITSIKENFSQADILNNQNEIIANLTSNYNKKAELYNSQIDLLGQNERIVEDHNKKLNSQLDDLSNIQDKIALKDRVIELNDELTKKQIRNKKILIGFFVLIPFLGIPLLLVVTKAFSQFIGLSIAGLMVFGYIIYMVVIANQNDVKKFGREDKRIISKYEKSIKNYLDKQKKALSDFISEKCPDDVDGENAEEESGGSGGSGGSGVYPKGDYLLKSNGPFYYYDGSAPPQQIYPGAVGSIEFGIDSKNYKFPKDIQEILNEIKNPITKFFFYTWLSILESNGIKPDDPRFAQDLDIIDFSDSDRTPMPFWDNIKLPIVTNVDKQFNYLFQSYSGEKKNISKTASVLLVDLWNFIFGDQIPGDIYQTWVNKLAIAVKKDNPNIEQFYQDYLDEIIKLPKFSEKYGTGFEGLMKFDELKMVDFIKTFNNDIHVSQPFSKKIVQ